MRPHRGPLERFRSLQGKDRREGLDCNLHPDRRTSQKYGRVLTPRCVTEAPWDIECMSYPTPQQAQALYAARDAQIAGLQAAGRIEHNHLSNLDRIGRFRVATELWDCCTPEARQALLTDAHPHVRSAAAIEDRRVLA